MIFDTYYHGSKIKNIKRLLIQGPKNPFGAAIYLTKDPRVARSYSGTEGAIYEVKLNGNQQLTINLDSPFSCQTSEAKEAIVKSLKSLDLYEKYLCEENVRYLIHHESSMTNKVNSTLITNGIWMLYGHLSIYEISGSMDSGVQYAIINGSKLKIVEEN